MSSREESASKTVEAHGAFMMHAMHQQFEWLNFLFEERLKIEWMGKMLS